MNYHSRLDKLFSNGEMWNHRTLRTIFDPFAAEWSRTTIEEKLKILEKMIDSGYPLVNWIIEFNEFYAIDLNKPHVPLSVPDALEVFYNRGNDKIKTEILMLPDDIILEIKDRLT